MSAGSWPGATLIQQTPPAAWADPRGEYFCDGDLWWTPAEVRAWWAGRRRVVEHLAEALADFESGDCAEAADAADGVRDFRAYLEGPLAGDLRAYPFRLEEGRPAEGGERLPELGGDGPRVLAPGRRPGRPLPGDGS
ncbi:hypothetical protein [Streptomyces sp. NPDC054961]